MDFNVPLVELQMRHRGMRRQKNLPILTGQDSFLLQEECRQDMRIRHRLNY